MASLRGVPSEIASTVSELKQTVHQLDYALASGLLSPEREVAVKELIDTAIVNVGDLAEWLSMGEVRVE